jgi:hypothetical protein
VEIAVARGGAGDVEQRVEVANRVFVSRRKRLEERVSTKVDALCGRIRGAAKMGG